MTTWSWAKVLSAALAGAYLCAPAASPERAFALAEPAAGGLLSRRPQEIVQLELVGEGGRLVLVRSAGGWQVTEPASAPAVSAAVEELLGTFRLGVVGVVGDRPEGLREYGLDRPAVRLRVAGPAWATTIRLGHENPSGTCCYALVEGTGTVVLVGLEYKRVWSRGPAYFVRAG